MDRENSLQQAHDTLEQLTDALLNHRVICESCAASDSRLPCWRRSVLEVALGEAHTLTYELERAL